MTGEPRRLIYRSRHRLTHALEFRAVYDAKLKAPSGPIVVFAKPNQLGHLRLGLSVGRRVGGAVTRNRIKRRLRDAFRAVAADWPHDSPGLDLVLVARSPRLEPMSALIERLDRAATKLAGVAERRSTTPAPPSDRTPEA